MPPAGPPPSFFNPVGNGISLAGCSGAGLSAWWLLIPAAELLIVGAEIGYIIDVHWRQLPNAQEEYFAGTVPTPEEIEQYEEDLWIGNHYCDWAWFC